MLLALALTVAALPVLWNALRAPLLQTVVVGSYGDWQVLRGWYSVEARGDQTWRWSSAQAELHFRPQGRGTGVVRLRLTSPLTSEIPAQVQLRLPGGAPIRFVVDARPREYTFLLPLPADGSGLQIELDSTTSTPPGDARQIGISIFAASELGPLFSGRVWWLLLATTAGTLLLGLLTAWLWSGRRGLLSSPGWLTTPLVLFSAGLLVGHSGFELGPLVLTGLTWLPCLALVLLVAGVLLTRWLGRARVAAWLVLVLALVAAAVLRFWKLNWDDWRLFHPDEWVFLLASLRLKPPWHPGFFSYGSLLLYLYRGTAALLAAVDGPVWLERIERFALIGRAYSAAASTATVAIVALLGWRTEKTRWAGLWATMLLVGAVLAIQNAHFATTDSMLALQVTLLAYVCVRYVQGGSWRTIMIGGAILGMALATKMIALTFAVLPAAALLLRLLQLQTELPEAVSRGRGTIRSLLQTMQKQWKRSLGHGGLALAAAIAACLICAPYYFLDWRGLVHTMSMEQSDATSGLADYTFQFLRTTPYLYPLQNALYTMGPALLLLGLAGWGYLLVRALRRRSAVDLLLLSWPCAYFLYIGGMHIKYIRWLVPLLPFLCLYAGILLGDMLRQARENRRVVPLLGWLIGGGAVLLTVGYALLFAWGVYGHPDPRLEASAWIYEHIPRDSRILTEQYDQRLPITIAEPDNPLAPAWGDYLYQMETLRVYMPEVMESPAYYAEQLSRADYLVLSSRSQYVTFRRFPDLFPVRACFYRNLMEGQLGYTRVSSFTRGLYLGSRRIDGEENPNLDETFQVFDHPTVIVLARTAAPEQVRQAVLKACK